MKNFKEYLNEDISLSKLDQVKSWNSLIELKKGGTMSFGPSNKIAALLNTIVNRAIDLKTITEEEGVTNNAILDDIDKLCIIAQTLYDQLETEDW